MNCMRPSRELVASFTVFLAQNFKTQKSVKSLLSTLITLLDRAGIRTYEFKTHQASMLVRSISINKRAPTCQRPPVDVDILRRIIRFWRASDQASLPLITAVLFMFTTSIRQSNLFPASQRQFDSSRHLIWADIAWRPNYIIYCLFDYVDAPGRSQILNALTSLR